jgi:hypothetical protein
MVRIKTCRLPPRRSPRNLQLGDLVVWLNLTSKTGASWTTSPCSVRWSAGSSSR